MLCGRAVCQQLKRFGEAVPDFSNYLAFLFASLPGDEMSVQIRRMAAIFLKNTLKTRMPTLSPSMVAYVQANLFRSVGDPARNIRITATSVIADLVRRFTFSSWPNLLESILSGFNSASPEVVEGCVELFRKLTEDCSKDIVEIKTVPLDAFIAKLVELMGNPVPAVRAGVMGAILPLVPKKPPALLNHVEAFLGALCQLTQDREPRVIELVCRSFNAMLQMPQYLSGCLALVIEYMLHVGRLPIEEAQMEACDFWSRIVEIEGAAPVLQPYIPRIIPVLIENMKYSQLELHLMGGAEQEDAGVPDRPEDIDPRLHMHNARMHTQHETMDSGDNLGMFGGTVACAKLLVCGAEGRELCLVVVAQVRWEEEMPTWEMTAMMMTATILERWRTILYGNALHRLWTT